MENANLIFAWVWMFVGLVTGTILGLRFHRADWLGGYGSWPRRMMRLGHVAFFGTGLLNLGFALTIARIDLEPQPPALVVVSALLIVGAVTMPLVCFASAWRPGARSLFAIPVLSLILAVGVFVAGLLMDVMPQE